MNATENYRYPGSRPFQDTELDRKLFFGRDQEKDALLHLVLAKKLVVIFGKSGMGKSSLVNAGLLQPLRTRHFMPLNVRFNVPQLDPVQTVFTGVKDVLSASGGEHAAGKETTLWEYFKTAEFWSADDTLLTPVLVLDQFEDFFDFHSTDIRSAFITQLADLVRGRVPKHLSPFDFAQGDGHGEQQGDSHRERSPVTLSGVEGRTMIEYTDTPPDIKIVIAIREDYLGQLDDLSYEIPEILDNRFRLTALKRQQAQEAIVKPAQVQDEHITTPGFNYAPKAITALLDFLCMRRQKIEVSQSLLRRYGMKLVNLVLWPFPRRSFLKAPSNYEIVKTDEVEPFQLQLLCQDIETKVQKRQQATVQQSDLGGEKGMQKVLQSFYDKQIKHIRWRKRRRVRKLCEKGLLSRSNRRLSLEEEDITRRFKVKKPLLNDLVNSRLLRAEPRVGSVYYELCHDTLVAPIRASSKKYTIKTRITRSIVAMILIIVSLFVAQAMSESYVIIKGVRAVLTFPEYLLARGYKRLGHILAWKIGNLEEAEIQYRKAIELYPELVNPYSNLGYILYNRGKYDEALLYLRRAIELHPTDAGSYEVIGHVFRAQKKYVEAIAQYRKGLELDSKMFWSYLGLGKALQLQGNYEEAIAQYQKAIELDPKGVSTYVSLGDALSAQGKYEEAIPQYQKTLELDPKNVFAYCGLGNVLKAQGKYDEAITQYQKALRLDPERGWEAYQQLGNVAYKQGKFDETRQFYHKAYDQYEKQYEKSYVRWIDTKMYFAERSLHVEQAEQAFALADDVVKRQLFSPADRLTMRFVVVTSLLYQQKRTEALTELQALLEYYRALTAYNEKYWDYETLHNVISMSQKLSDADKPCC
jgi:tetratricopeptide (TPR) repeat protein